MYPSTYLGKDTINSEAEIVISAGSNSRGLIPQKIIAVTKHHQCPSKRPIQVIGNPNSKPKISQFYQEIQRIGKEVQVPIKGKISIKDRSIVSIGIEITNRPLASY